MRRLTALVLAAASAVMSMAAPPAQAAVTPAGPLVAASAFGRHDLQQSASARYGAIRLWDTGTTWADLQPARGVYRWGRLDSYVARAAARRIKVTLVLGTTPTWAAGDPEVASAPWLGAGSASPPRSEADWVAYVGAVARRYRGRIDSYQVWNEASLPQFWRGTPAQLARLTQLANSRIKATDQAATVVSTAMLPRQSAWATWSTAYLKALAVRGWPVDAFAVHSYQPDAIATPDGRVLTLRRFRALLVAVRAPKRVVWDTEANYSSPTFAWRKVTGQRAADWTARAYLDSIRTGVTRTFWCAFYNPVPQLGVTMTPGGTSQRAFATVQNWLVGSTYQGCASSKAATRVVLTTCSFRRGTRTSRVVWASANARTALPVRAGTVCRLVTGCTPINRTTYVSTSPVLLR